MNTTVPKQFLLLAGRPLLVYSLMAFSEAYPDIALVLVLPEPFIPEWERLCSLHEITLVHQVVSGGETRFHSVRNALPLVSSEGFIAIHDGVRPMATPELIRRCFDSAASMGNAVPVIPVTESLRIVLGSENRPEERERIRIVQTPQVFRAASLKNAYKQDFDVTFTDDATVMERWGEKIHLVPGLPENIKITTPRDLEVAVFFMKTDE
jgi:2-C-methyl-D-erythritol 4-phosphate cytidylyltransferase